MSRPTLRLIGSLALCLVLAASLPLAGTQQSGAAPPRPIATQAIAPVGLWALVWTTVHSLWTKAGCSLDPYGRCLPASPTPHLDGGFRVDPYGTCLPGR